MTAHQTAALNPPAGRWLQLLIGIVCMVMIANLQYGWTLFVKPIDAKHGWDRAAIQVAFTHLRAHRDLAGADRRLVRRPLRPRDRRGDRRRAGRHRLGAERLCQTRSPCSTSRAAIGGIGAGAVYGTCVGNALKWFPDRRGLAAGLTAAGFGAGSALTIIPIQRHDPAVGYEAAFFWFGLGQGVIVFVLAWLLLARRGRARCRRRRTSAAIDAQLHARRDAAHARSSG